MNPSEPLPHQQRLEQVLRRLLPLDAQTRIVFETVHSSEGTLPETLLRFERTGQPALHFHLHGALADIDEEELVRVLVYRPGSSCAHPHHP